MSDPQVEQRVEQHVVLMGNANFQACAHFCSIAKSLGNCVAYHGRHLIFDNLKLGSASDFDKAIRELYEPVYRAMPSSAAAQRQVQIIHEQFKSFFAAMAEYHETPERFLGRPRLPGYAEKFRTGVVGRNGYRIKDGYLILSGAEKFGFEPIKVQCCQNQRLNAKADEAVCGDVRICPKGHSFVIEITYRKEVHPENFSYLRKDHALSVDFGLNNIVAGIATKPGLPTLLVKGGQFKSVNQLWNKSCAELRAQSAALLHEAAKFTVLSNVLKAEAVMLTAQERALSSEAEQITARKMALKTEDEQLIANGKSRDASVKLTALWLDCEAKLKQIAAQNKAQESDDKLRAARELDNKATPYLHRAQSKLNHVADITRKRNQRIGDLSHKTANAVIAFCLDNQLGTIILGHNPDWKQGINLGRRVNQKFVNIPYAQIIQKIQYRAKEYGITVIVREESYTSKASALDFDPMLASYQKGAQCTFSGKRIQRGLYRTKNGQLINADLNGALNIGRKELGDNWLRQSLANGGFVDKPVVIRNLHQKIR